MLLILDIRQNQTAASAEDTIITIIPYLTLILRMAIWLRKTVWTADMLNITIQQYLPAAIAEGTIIIHILYLVSIPRMDTLKLTYVLIAVMSLHHM